MSRSTTLAASLVLCCGVFAQEQPSGVPARSTSADYSAHVTVGGVTYAASLVPPNEVKHVFAFDISKDYVVFEVAVYSPLGSSLQVNPDSFVLRSSQASDPVRRADSTTVASVIQQKNLPRQQQASGLESVGVAAEVGYETGRDPYTGRRVHRTYTATEVGASVGDNRMPPPVFPGGYPQDRELLEKQLWDRSLPAGQVRQSAAGYLYFPSSLLKKKAGAVYELEYLGPDQEPALSGSPSSRTIELRVPAKNR
jgi:hypothetical protein